MSAVSLHERSIIRCNDGNLDEGDGSVPWCTDDPNACDLAGLWNRTYQLWTSRDRQAAEDELLRMETSASVDEALVTIATEQGLQPGSSTDAPPPRTPVAAPRTPGGEPSEATPTSDCGHTELDRWLTKIHINVGHIPGPQMAHCLKEAGYDKTTVNRARNLHCGLCNKFKHTVASRPMKMMRSRVLGRVVALDFSFHVIHGTQYMTLHFVCEASRFHYAHLVGESADGNCSSRQLCQLVPRWTNSMGYPQRFHVDSEGCFKGDEFLQY